MLNQIKQIKLNLAISTVVALGLTSMIQLYNFGRFTRIETDIIINKQDVKFKFKDLDI